MLWIEHQRLMRAQIAEQLWVSPAAVPTHWKNLQRKLGLDQEGVRRWLRAKLAATRTQTSI